MSAELGPFPTAGEVVAQHGFQLDDVVELARRMRLGLAAEVAAVVEEAASAVGAIPEVAFGDVASGTIADDVRDRIRRRGCVIVRGGVDRALAEEWDREIGSYLATNRFEEQHVARNGAQEAPGSGIVGVYWSRPQVAARQHPHVVVLRRFLNGFWRDGSRGAAGFDPDRDIGYPDRLRRRAPGAAARGLRLHVDAASKGGWRLPENRVVFADVLAGRPDRYDPWDVAGRTAEGTVPEGTASVFRTFQGWTALTEMRPTDGGLHVIPIPSAVALSIVDGLAADLARRATASTTTRAVADELCLPALVPIPIVEPGDSVWWHGDLFHSVAPAANTERWSNVMYVGVTPVCPRNERYRATMLERFVEGRSPVDFPDEDVEVGFAGRAGVADLDDVGRSQFGLDPIVRT